MNREEFLKKTKVHNIAITLSVMKKKTKFRSQVSWYIRFLNLFSVWRLKVAILVETMNQIACGLENHFSVTSL